MAIKWGDITTTAWIVSLVISGAIVLLAMPYMQDLVGIVRLLWVVYTNEWSGGW